MPRLTDAAEVRRRLETDRAWSIYALGDLSPGFAEHSEWYAQGLGLALLYRSFSTPVLFTLGEPAQVEPLIVEISVEPEMYLSIRPEILPLVKRRYLVRHETAMWRMLLPEGAFRAPAGAAAQPLSAADLPALRALYDDGRPTGEVPDFFSPSMLDQGVFYGVREGEALIAAAGTHLVSAQESVGAIGNVYTRRDRRGQGLAARVTGAVAADLVGKGLRTVALNVNQANAAAIRVYERLGFVKYCPFYEGVAYRN